MRHSYRTAAACLAAVAAVAATSGAAAAATAETAATPDASGTATHLVPGGHTVLTRGARTAGRPAAGVRPDGAGSWSSQSTEPVLYNYGLIYTGPVINPPTGIPAGAVITDVCWTWNYAYPHPAPGIWVYIYNNTQGFYDTSGNELGCTTLDNGESANQQFEFGFASPTSISGYYPAILPPAQPSGPATVTVDYTY